jgi:hypothetical protein
VEPEAAWLYPYWDDPSGEGSRRLGRRPLRPIIEVALLGPSGRQVVPALVDSGSEHTLAAPWLARAVGVVPDEERSISLGIGGDTQRVGFAHATLALLPPKTAPPRQPIEWEAEVGFFNRWRPPWQLLLGQIGFFDRFTVTMHRHAQAVAVEGFDVFDGRFGMLVDQAENREPRFKV